MHFSDGTLLIFFSKKKDFRVTHLQPVAVQMRAGINIFSGFSVTVLLNFTLPGLRFFFPFASHFVYSGQPPKQRKYQPEKNEV